MLALTFTLLLIFDILGMTLSATFKQSTRLSS